MDFYYTFVNKALRELIRNYIKRNREQEVFLGLVGRIKAKKQDNPFLLYEITDTIAFPNISNNPDYQAMVTESWYDILFENLQLRQSTTLSPLGVLHSHVKGGNKASDLDLSFMKNLSKKLDRFIMIIISYTAVKGFHETAYVLIKEEEIKILECKPFP